jgi:hypothetical protein
VPRPADQHPISDLGPGCAHPPFGISVRSRRPDRRPDHPRAVTRKDAIEYRRALTVPVADQEPDALAAIAGFLDIDEDLIAVAAEASPPR